LQRIELLKQDAPGYSEVHGYHTVAIHGKNRAIRTIDSSAGFTAFSDRKTDLFEEAKRAD
jgi:hypothetical protein